jgi:hypothetical protein
MVLTNLTFVHTSIMDYYSLGEQTPTLTRAHVDENFNRAGVAMNYIARIVTYMGLLYVGGQEPGSEKGDRQGEQRGRAPCKEESVIGFFFSLVK